MKQHAEQAMSEIGLFSARHPLEGQNKKVFQRCADLAQDILDDHITFEAAKARVSSSSRNYLLDDTPRSEHKGSGSSIEVTPGAPSVFSKKQAPAQVQAEVNPSDEIFAVTDSQIANVKDLNSAELNPLPRISRLEKHFNEKLADPLELIVEQSREDESRIGRFSEVKPLPGQSSSFKQPMFNIDDLESVHDRVDLSDPRLKQLQDELRHHAGNDKSSIMSGRHLNEDVHSSNHDPRTRLASYNSDPSSRLNHFTKRQSTFGQRSKEPTPFTGVKVFSEKNIRLPQDTPPTDNYQSELAKTIGSERNDHPFPKIAQSAHSVESADYKLVPDVPNPLRRSQTDIGKLSNAQPSRSPPEPAAAPVPAGPPISGNTQDSAYSFSKFQPVDLSLNMPPSAGAVPRYSQESNLIPSLAPTPGEAAHLPLKSPVSKKATLEANTQQQQNQSQMTISPLNKSVSYQPVDAAPSSASLPLSSHPTFRNAAAPPTQQPPTENITSIPTLLAPKKPLQPQLPAPHQITGPIKSSLP